MSATPTLQRITLYPIKSLDGVSVSEATLLPGGALAHDREYCMVDADGKLVNGKRTPLVTTVRCIWDLAARTVALHRADQPATVARNYHLDTDRRALEAWLSDHFDLDITLQRNTHIGFPDDPDFHGPTLISTASLDHVATWFPGIDRATAHLRFRVNLEIADCEPFWEDRLVDPEAGTAVTFQVGDVQMLGVNPCFRCIVPTRDPLTGAPIERFQRDLADHRRAELPEWAAPARFVQTYRLSTNTVVEPDQQGRVIRVGDTLAITGRRPSPVWPKKD